MKITKLFLPVFVVISLMLISNSSKADDEVLVSTEKTSVAEKEISETTISNLNYQLVKEIKSNLEKPLLVFKDKNLTGDVSVTVKIAKNGKIKFLRVNGGNKNLSKNVMEKLNSLNLWTGTNAAGLTFNYKISFSQ